VKRDPRDDGRQVPTTPLGLMAAFAVELANLPAVAGLMLPVSQRIAAARAAGRAPDPLDVESLELLEILGAAQGRVRALMERQAARKSAEARAKAGASQEAFPEPPADRAPLGLAP